MSISLHHPQRVCPYACVLSAVAVAATQIRNGVTFVSETDTEVIPKLLKFAYDGMMAEREAAAVADGGPPPARVPFPKARMLMSAPHNTTVLLS
jgi:hypothetical protein